jgi:hypothetical protein
MRRLGHRFARTVSVASLFAGCPSPCSFSIDYPSMGTEKNLPENNKKKKKPNPTIITPTQKHPVSNGFPSGIPTIHHQTTVTSVDQ